MTETSPAESHLMRRRPPRGTGSDGLVVYSLEDLLAPPGEAPTAVIEVTVSGDAATLVGGGVRPEHRGHGHGRRLSRQVMAELRAEGCRRVHAADPPDGPGRRMLLALGFVPDTPGRLRLDL